MLAFYFLKLLLSLCPTLSFVSTPSSLSSQMFRDQIAVEGNLIRLAIGGFAGSWLFIFLVTVSLGVSLHVTINRMGITLLLIEWVLLRYY